MGDSSASYIHKVQHLIEKCLTYQMTKEECMEALSKHANIQPLITSTVWNELEKENKDFFESYAQRQKEEQETQTHTEAETIRLLQNISASATLSPPQPSSPSQSSPANSSD